MMRYLLKIAFFSTLSLSTWSAELSNPQSVPSGYVRTYSFAVQPNTSYLIEVLTEGSFACSGLPSKTCCAVLTSTTNGDISSGDFDTVAASSTDRILVNVQSSDDSTMDVAVYGFDTCRFDPPRLTDRGGIAESRFIGQATGQLANALELQTTGAMGGEYFMHDTSRQADLDGDMPASQAIRTERVFGYFDAYGIYLTDLSPSTSNFWTTRDSQELADAHHHSGIVYDYFREVLGINSFDNEGSQMIAHVNGYYPATTRNFCGYEVPPGGLFNAFWNGYNILFTQRDMVDFFDGETKEISLAAALDVAAHEWGHGVSDRAVDLKYERESGALNEAFSDWIGVAVEHYSGEDNWTIGEGVETIRDLSDPLRFRQPDTYLGERWYPTDTDSCPTPDICENDYCGVHRNSGVPNKMFYLLSEGGTHNGITVTGLGVDTALKIAYDALRYHWASNETFIGAREGMVAAAQSYGDNAVEQVSNAWNAVGVPESSSPPPTSNSASSGGSGGGGCSVATGPHRDAALLLLLIALISRRIRVSR